MDQAECRPYGAPGSELRRFPPLKRWATIFRPCRDLLCRSGLFVLRNWKAGAIFRSTGAGLTSWNDSYDEASLASRGDAYDEASLAPRGDAYDEASALHRGTILTSWPRSCIVI